MTEANEPGGPSPEWAGLHDYLTHLFSAAGPGDGASPLIRAIESQRLQASRSEGYAGADGAAPMSQNALTFLETPLHLLASVVGDEPRFGIAFHRPDLLRKNAHPVWRLLRGLPPDRAVKALVAEAQHDPAHPIWAMTPFFERQEFYAHSSLFYDDIRRWRIVGDLEFERREVAFLVVPERHQTKIEDALRVAPSTGETSPLDIPILDASWAPSRRREVLSRIGTR